ncbi:host attachment family protein [Alsobacter sp. SYSU M60028]|uniref:Host attachment family protein n=1 Tax=Alsobacter ponti TaxID=2962936 RepID=A0ABT1LC64_9HYPH|nr:host attachment family protein [Alsobacter ponti]MCP8938666.1 host attachment family protein [Alsobacter ponti]
MAEFLVPHDAWVIVGDGRRALFLRNEGRPDRIALTVHRVLASENPPTREQGSDRPGRAMSSMGTGRSAYADTDWHEMEEHRFAGEIVRGLTALAASGQMNAVVLVAPPKVLGDLRAALPDNLKSAVIGELHKDLTKHTVDDIARNLAS